MGVMVATGQKKSLQQSYIQFIGHPKEDIAKLRIGDETVVEMNLSRSAINKIFYIEQYWNWFYENINEFQNYISTLLQRKEIQTEEQIEDYKANFLNQLDRTVDAVSEFIFKQFDIANDWVNPGKRTSTSFFIDKNDALDVARFIVALIVAFPIYNNPVHWFLQTNDVIFHKYEKQIKILMKLGMSRVKFDSFHMLSTYMTLVNNQSAFFFNFSFSLFNLVACSPVFLPPHLEDEKNTRLKNFFGYFVSIISENQGFIVKSFINKEFDAKITNAVLRKEVNQDPLHTLYSTLVAFRVLNVLDKKLTQIRQLQPTYITQFVLEMLKISLGISPQILERYPLEFQYILYNVYKKNDKLRKSIGTGLELLRVGVKGKEKKIKVSNNLPIVAALMRKDIPYLELILNRINMMTKIKRQELYYLDDPDKEFIKTKINKQLSDFIVHYLQVVVENKSGLILEIQKSFNKLKLYVKDKNDLKLITNTVL